MVAGELILQSKVITTNIIEHYFVSLKTSINNTERQNTTHTLITVSPRYKTDQVETSHSASS